LLIWYTDVAAAGVVALVRFATGLTSLTLARKFLNLLDDPLENNATGDII